MRLRAFLVPAVALAVVACTGPVRNGRRTPRGLDAPVTPPAPTGPVGTAPPAPRTGPAVEAPVGVEDRYVGKLSRAEQEEFRAAWALFVRKDAAWPEARDRWLARGGVSGYVLAENLLRYFVSASKYGERTDLNRVALAAKKVGEPAVAYFASLLVLDQRPLDQPVQSVDADGKPVTITVWRNDDVTRQHLAYILSAIGEPAVPMLSSEPYLRAPSPSARRYVAYALGRIGTDRAVDALASAMSAPDWQDRASVAKALGLALNFAKNQRARAVLDRARADPDPFVRKKVEEGLEGRTKSEF